jgi:hypothetical protein
MRRFVITGCGRSGTNYIATVMRRMGVSCGHENVFRHQSRPPFDFHGYDGDASWLAAPWLTSLPDDVVAIHQLRDPMPTIRSWVSTGLFDRVRLEGGLIRHLGKRLLHAPPAGYYAHRVFVRRHAPEVFTERGPVTRAARYWVDWNRMVEHASAGHPYLSFGLGQIDEGLVTRILDLIEVPNHDRIGEALSSVPHDVNARPPRAQVTDDDVLSGPLGTQVIELAERHGLTPPRSSRAGTTTRTPLPGAGR